MSSNNTHYNDNHLVVPGQMIAKGDDFLRGHGTYVEQQSSLEENDATTTTVAAAVESSSSSRPYCLIASVAGQVQRVNKLISVIPLNLYTPQVGDLIVGRIIAVQSSSTGSGSRWKVQLSSNNNTTTMVAQLPLAGVHLKGGAQRIKTQQDSLQMRRLFQEGDLVSAEVAKVMNNNAIMLHTRSLKYGKLENGMLVKVPSCLVARRKNHVYTTKNGIFLILMGRNGWIWIQKSLYPVEDDSSSTTTNTSITNLSVEQMERLQKDHIEQRLDVSERHAMVKLGHSIRALANVGSEITPERIEHVFSKILMMNDEESSLLMTPESMVKVTRDLI